jgi:hypothetical protein
LTPHLHDLVRHHDSNGTLDEIKPDQQGGKKNIYRSGMAHAKQCKQCLIKTKILGRCHCKQNPSDNEQVVLIYRSSMFLMWFYVAFVYGSFMRLYITFVFGSSMWNEAYRGDMSRQWIGSDFNTIQRREPIISKLI